MNLPQAPQTYDPRDQSEMRAEIERADADNFKRGGDIEISDGKIIVRSANGNRWVLVASNAGVASFDPA